MTSKAKRCVVDETVLFIMSISRWLALAPVRFTKSRDKTFMYISRTFVIYGLVFSVVVGFFITYVMYMDVKAIFTGINKRNDTEHTNVVLRICDFILSNGLVSIGIINATRKMKTSMYCVETMRKIKNNILGGDRESVSKQKILILTVVCLLVTWILKIAEMKIYYDFLQADEEILILSILIVMELQFAVMALCIKSGFQAVNESLRIVISNLEQQTNSRSFLKPDFLKIHVKSINAAIDLIGMTDQRYPDVIVEKRLKLSQKVREISQSYVRVCDVLREFNDSESTTMFIQLTTLTLHMIITVFNFVKTFHVRGNEQDIMVLQCFWFVYHVSKMILLVEPCCRTEQEVAETRILVGKLICHVTTEADPLQDETEAFYNHILLNEVSYTAFGICSLGRPLLSKVIGGVTTILMLLF